MRLPDVTGGKMKSTKDSSARAYARAYARAHVRECNTHPVGHAPRTLRPHPAAPWVPGAGRYTLYIKRLRR